MANKMFWPGMLILVLVFGTIGCDNASNDGSAGGSGVDPDDITYTVEANGTLDTETSTQLTFTFNAAVSGLGVGDFDIFEGTGEAEINTSKPIREILTGGDKIWKLSITKVTAGSIRVKIDKKGIERGRKTVFVYKDNAQGSDKDEAITLSSSEWLNGSVDRGKEQWFKFDVESGGNYAVQWKDNSERPASEDYTVTIKVTAYQSDGKTSIFEYFGQFTHGFSQPKPVSGLSGTVYLKVEPYYGQGNYAIRFFDPASMPRVLIMAESARTTIVPSVVVKWYVSSQSENPGEVKGFRVYRSNTQTGTYTQIGEDYSVTNIPLVDFTTKDTEKIIYIDKNVTVGSTYWYKISAYNSVGEGEPSDLIQSEAVPGPTSEPLDIGAQATESNITEVDQVDWYTFTAETGKTYRVQWESAYDNHVGWMRGGYAVMKVSVFMSDKELINFTDSYGNGAMAGWGTPGTVSGVNGTVYLKVELDQKAEYAFGKYTIKVDRE